MRAAASTNASPRCCAAWNSIWTWRNTGISWRLPCAMADITTNSTTSYSRADGTANCCSDCAKPGHWRMREEARRWKSDLQKLIDLRGAALQVAQYIAVISGLKRSLDDWIPVGQFERFRSLVAALGLAMEIDCVFRRLSDAQSVFGLRYAP